jgi:hypothetical protein
VAGYLISIRIRMFPNLVGRDSYEYRILTKTVPNILPRMELDVKQKAPRLGGTETTTLTVARTVNDYIRF